MFNWYAKHHPLRDKLKRQYREIEMSDIRIRLEELQRRGISFRTLGHLLKEKGIPTKKGWAALLAEHAQDPANQQMKIEWLAALESIHLNHLRYGDKAVSIYNIASTEASNQLSAILESLVESDSPFSNAYPFTISEEDLRELSFHPVGTRYKNLGDGKFRLVFCVRRYIKSKIELEADDYEGDVRDVILGFDEIYGIRQGYVQCFDIVYFDQNSKQLEIQIDTSTPLTGEDVNRSMRYYEQVLNEQGRQQLRVDNILGQPVNLFPKIRTLYDHVDGNINSLGHTTTSASIKDERMRKRNTDLRQEPFHKGGLVGVNQHTNLYSVTKSWPGEYAFSSPKVIIPGHFSLAGNQHAHIGYALVSSCVTKGDFRMLISKLS
jgi:hypothetical protein